MPFNIKTSIQLEQGLLPDYQSWQQAQEGEFTLWNYLDVRADFQLAAAFSKLFWPDFVEVDDAVFLAEQFDQANVQQWQHHYGNDRKAVESMVNHVHVYDLFNNTGDDPNKLAQAEYLGRVLAVCWRHALQEAFPTRKFTVEYATEPEEYGPTLSFFQAE